jgi:hypothetical protein
VTQATVRRRLPPHRRIHRPIVATDASPRTQASERAHPSSEHLTAPDVALIASDSTSRRTVPRPSTRELPQAATLSDGPAEAHAPSDSSRAAKSTQDRVSRR